MKLSGKIYSGILAMLGFSACDIIGVPMYGPVAPEYGVLHTGYRLIVNITADEKPVDAIKISVQNTISEPPHTVVSVNTGVNGKYVVNWTYTDLTSLILLVEDVDGEANGGDFASQTRALPDAKMWTYDGDYDAMTAEMNFELVKKTAEEEHENE